MFAQAALASSLSPPSPRPAHARAEVDGVLAVGVAIAAGALLRHHAWEVLASALAAACVLWQVRRGRGIALLLFIAAGLGLGGCRAARAVAAHERVLARVDGDAPGIQRCDGMARVVASPVWARRTLRWVGEVTEASCGERAVRGPFRATFYDSGGVSALARGDVVAFVAQLGPPERLTNFDTPDPVPFEVRRGEVRSGGVFDVRIVTPGQGPLAWIDRERARVRARIEATFPADTAPMARAMVLGENDLTTEDDAAFRGSGLSHLLAVSGMHLVLVVVSLTAALRAVLIRIEAIAAHVDAGRVASALGIGLCFLYADFAGGSGSAFRAAWMTSAVLFARVLGRRGDGARALGLSIAGMSLHDPLVAHDLSFVLSVLATAGLLVVGPAIEKWLSRVPYLPAKLVRPLAATTGATVACAPVLLSLSTALPLGGIVANLVAVPIGEMVSLPLCLVHALLAPLPEVERGCAEVASLALLAVRAIARWFSSLSFLAMPLPPPTAGQIGVMCVAALGGMLLRKRAALVAGSLLLLVALEVRARLDGAPTGLLRVTFLDVGQGDAALVDLPNGDAMLIDGGGIVGSPIDVGAKVIAPTLRARRREAVSHVVLSHPHPDHYGGLPTGLADVAVGALWDTGQGERESMAEGARGGYAALLQTARAKEATVQRPEALCGVHSVGGARIEVLAPCPSLHPDRGPNDNSLVLRVVYGERRILFTGDAEHEAEGDLLHRPRDSLRADVLKVGHHGSRTSTSPDFVAAVGPAEAVISTGARNRFGHPAPETLATLGRAKTRIWRTDRHGAVVVETDGRSLRIESAEDTVEEEALAE